MPLLSGHGIPVILRFDFDQEFRSADVSLDDPVIVCKEISGFENREKLRQVIRVSQV